MSNRSRNKKRKYFDMQFVITGISVTLVLLLIGIVTVFSLSTYKLSNYIKESISFSVILDENSTESSSNKILKDINKLPFVKETKYISKEDALKEHIELNENSPEDFLGYNPFSPSIEIKLKHNYTNLDSIRNIADQLKLKSDIKKVEYRNSLIEDVDKNTKRINISMIVIISLLMIISISLINNTIRLSVYSNRYIINTMQLVGATNSFIRKPFIKKVILCGIIASMVANIIIQGSVLWIRYSYPMFKTIFTLEVMLLSSVFIVLVAIMMTWICSYFAVNRFLRLSSNEVYYI